MNCCPACDDGDPAGTPGDAAAAGDRAAGRAPDQVLFVGDGRLRGGVVALREVARADTLIQTFQPELTAQQQQNG